MMPKLIHVDACEPLPFGARYPAIAYDYRAFGRRRYAVAVGEVSSEPDGCGLMDSRDDVRAFAERQRAAFLDNAPGIREDTRDGG